VQNRVTGQLEEEKMQVYVRLGIRLLYKVYILYGSVFDDLPYSNQGAKSRMEGARGTYLSFDIEVIPRSIDDISQPETSSSPCPLSKGQNMTLPTP
jgi:hypothetical protein